MRANAIRQTFYCSTRTEKANLDAGRRGVDGTSEASDISSPRRVRQQSPGQRPGRATHVSFSPNGAGSVPEPSSIPKVGVKRVGTFVNPEGGHPNQGVTLAVQHRWSFYFSTASRSGLNRSSTLGCSPSNCR